ncbi:MAG: hypothetical protein KGI99_02800 [Bradyrhizobium sp.]|uniref:hypothetical protein n=1 Tax=Bradyrhizobium sp. TaxID=376 RepID=UPI001C29BA04|nr:hypothetical protein [Bradyrhizobium sp.]MBU6461115.1 hypothetical protein [Pseudomonadota bacterium]MDE2066191.1 hypothetical protein [Bradyrhizobium sp.]
MGSGEIERARQKDVEESLTEVEFALVLSRIISSVNDDPEQLRHTIYDLARYKLEEQLKATGNTEQNRKSVRALETAIRGVEEFSQKKQEIAPARRYQSLEQAESRSERQSFERISRSLSYTPSFDDAVAVVPPPVRTSQRWPTIVRWTGLICLPVIVLFAARYRETLFTEVQQFKKPVSVASSVPTISEPVLPKNVPLAPSPLLPTTFGVYGVSNDKLFELNMLPGKAQDIRVAISPTVGISDQPNLPSGRVRFIVYRREAALSIPERAEVRIIAKVAHAISFNAAGKQVVTDDDGWYIRNISFPYRVAPIKENPEMFEIRAENDGAELSPGRYALVLRGQLYDFVIDGKVTDARHCLERMAAANGTFVSECKDL